jgi:hypothetical protein
VIEPRLRAPLRTQRQREPSGGAGSRWQEDGLRGGGLQEIMAGPRRPSRMRRGRLWAEASPLPVPAPLPPDRIAYRSLATTGKKGRLSP